MSKINMIILEGNATKDAVMYGSGNKKVTRFDLAYNSYDAKNEEQKTSFFQVLCFGKLAKEAARIQKGNALVIQGSIEVQVRTFEGQEYKNIVITASKISGIPSVTCPRQEDYFLEDIFMATPQEEPINVDMKGFNEHMTP